jgi:hypothetical protein
LSRERLTIQLRHHQLVSDGVNVVVQCNPDGTATYIPGAEDDTWYDFTDHTDGLDKLSMSWNKTNQAASSDTNQGGSNYDKGVSVEVVFTGAAYEFIYNRLLTRPCDNLNAIDVLITDQLCDRQYRIFEIKADNLNYSPFGRPCEFSIPLREADPVWHCVHKTFIWDNWQNWFNNGSAKQHPCFLTGIEPRPRLVNSARMGFAIFWQTNPVIVGLGLPLPGGNAPFRRIICVDNFVDAPLIRDIISNAAGKCGLSIDTMFHDPANPYYNLCLYYPLTGAFHKNDGGSANSPALWYHLENRWNVTLAEFLDKLKPVFEAEWYVTPNATLVFKPHNEYLNVTPALDLVERSDLWDPETLEYTMNGDKKPAYGRYQYALDASDLASNETQGIYNDIVDYDGPASNPMLEGSRQKNFEFASTGFIRDGRAQSDYTRDLCNDGETVAYALIVLLAVVIAALAAGVLSIGAAAALAGYLAAWAVNIASKANDLRDLFGSDTYTGAVRLTAEEVAQPRLILWNGSSLNRAKAVDSEASSLTANTYFNPASQPYTARNPWQYNPTSGFKVFNYPMYIEPYFTGNIFDRYQNPVDNPLVSKEINQSFQLETDFCCEIGDILGIWDGTSAAIGDIWKLEEREGYDVLGRIDSFDTSHGDEKIKVTGKVLNVTT